MTTVIVKQPLALSRSDYYILYREQCTLYSSEYSVHGNGLGTVYTLHRHILYAVHCTLSTVHCTL